MTAGAVPRPQTPGPGQESVWDYPRPPRLEQVERHVRVVHAGAVVADSRRAWRVLETSHPPVYYVPEADVRMDLLRPSRAASSYCEWKGAAAYYDVDVPGVDRVREAAFSYSRPTPAFQPIAGHLAFYAGAVDECTVDGGSVRPQPGGFYAGWITDDVVGPFKGEPGTRGW